MSVGERDGQPVLILCAGAIVDAVLLRALHLVRAPLVDEVRAMNEPMGEQDCEAVERAVHGPEWRAITGTSAAERRATATGREPASADARAQLATHLVVFDSRCLRLEGESL